MFQRRSLYGTVAIFVMIAVLLTSAYSVQRRIDLKPRQPLIQRLLLSLPSAAYMKSATIGFEALVADLIWAHTVVLFGEQVVTTREYPGLYNTLDVITVLDPLFNEVYHLGSIMLGMQARQVDESMVLLEKGIQNYPDDWHLYFITGFYYTYYKKDDVKALEYFEKAKSLPGSPTYLPRLIANLYERTGKIELALEFLYEAYKGFKDENMRVEVEKQIKDLLVEGNIIILNDAIQHYHSVSGTYPTKLEQLVQAELISQVPDEPRGGQYVIHPQTGKVTSVKLLFHLELKFQRDLDSDNGLSDELRKAFSAHEITLSEEAILTVEEMGRRWKITDREKDREQRYRIQKEKGQLTIYNVKGESP